ncbi:MAG: glycosyl transferase, partial [Anaerolineales bacterium]
MDQTGTLLSYIRESEAAQEALRLLGQKGYRKRVLLQRSAEGQIKRSDPNIRLRFILILVSGLMISAAGGILALAGYLPSLLPRFSTNLLLSIFLGFGVGMLLGWPAALVLLPGVSKTVTSHQSTWLRSGESLLILQAPLQSLSPAVKLLRDSIETEVSIFAQHPLRQFPGSPDLRELTALPLPQIKAFASHLAEEQQIEIQKRSRRDLLSKLDQARQIIHIICGDMSEALHLEQRLGPIGEWILDNEYLIESHGRDVKINLSKSFYRELPTLIGDPNRGSPRVYSLANELITHCDTRIDRENITAFLSAYQDHTPLTIGELWALPLMLRVALIHRIEDMARQAWQELREREFADFWANRLLSTLRRDPDQLFAVLADLAQERGRPSPYFAIQLSGHLYDEDAALVPVQSWLERTLQRPLTELHSGEQSRQAANQISIGNAITSLRQLSLLDWREVFEEQNRVELILRRDPAGFYSQMDFGTRNQYRDAVEVLAKRAGIAQIEIARKVVEMASAGKGSQDGLSRQRHVGTYLIGEGRRQFSKSLGCRENWRYLAKDWAYRHPAGIYLTSVTLLSMGLLAYPILDCLRFGASLFEQGVIALLAFPASQIAVEVVNYLITRILPARRLPKLDFAREGIPDEYRTLVVVPILLTDEATIKNEIEKLEIRYVANPEQNLIFSLFSDFKDAPGETAPDDDLLLSITEEGIEELNAHYGEGRFYLFHRQRTWSETEERFIGWERKRGKLEELNRLILGLRGEDEPSIVYVGDEDRLTGIRYIITLDSDTQLPRDSARRMIETLAHPLNQPRLDKNGQIAQGSYTLLQPRVSPSLPSAVASTFSRIYTDPVGTDPYTRVVSNAYQDLSGEGSYIGKGIYDPRFFHTILADRFPDERLLSHDLIEGAHVRTGLATDIELFDEFPSDYISYSLRKHRWIRGDWQIADWIFPKVPTRNKTRVPNPLSLLNRWKIFDNLRRSLVPAASVGVLIGSWFIVNNLQPYVAVLIGSVIFFQSLTGPLTWATSRHGLRSFSFRQIRHDLTRALADTALLFHQAGLALDAILRVFYRRAISRRGLLEWTTAQMTEWGTRKKKNIFQYNFWLISLLSLGLGIGLFLLRPESLLFALPWLALWFSSPLVGWALTRKPSLRETEGKLSEHDIQSLRLIARRTWRYFADFMGPDTAWLPPDNYQVSHKDQVALRTSPTNIGLGMLSTLAAYDFGYQTLDQTIDRLSHTMATIKQLDRHEGHLLNWYSLDDLTT